MHNKSGRPPVIILGMHRSGTSMIFSLLRELGFFAGVNLDENLESRFFQRRNQWIMRRAGGSWDYPLPVKKLCQEDSLKKDVINLFKHSVSSRQFYGFTGSKSHLLFNKCSELQSPWGWKDPRSIFTLSLWLPLFPHMRIILITRNGIDVAKSLTTRENKFIINDARSVRIKSILHRLKGSLNPFESHPSSSTRCTSLAESFKLWEEYTEEGQNVFNKFKGDKLLVRYEDVLSDPSSHLQEIAQFSELDYSPEGIKNITGKVNIGRAYAFTKDEQLCDLYEKVRNSKSMKHFGYDNIH